MEVLQTLNSSWKSHTLVQSQKKKRTRETDTNKASLINVSRSKTPDICQVLTEFFLSFLKGNF